ncbi:hypothetical protein ACFL2H_13150 [Planctomycetota bacterium]
MPATIPFRPKLTVNRAFMQEFISAEPPCLALGMVEEQGRLGGFWALRTEQAIPAEVSAKGMNFGHSLLGTSEMEVIQFSFEFYGFETYNVLVNPNNRVVQGVLEVMMEAGDYFFFALDPNNHVTAFRAEIEQDLLVGLRANLFRVEFSTTSETEYQQAVEKFARNPKPPGTMLNWVCRENVEYLDVQADPLDLTPRAIASHCKRLDKQGRHAGCLDCLDAATLFCRVVQFAVCVHELERTVKKDSVGLASVQLAATHSM